MFPVYCGWKQNNSDVYRKTTAGGRGGAGERRCVRIFSTKYIVAPLTFSAAADTAGHPGYSISRGGRILIRIKQHYSLIFDLFQSLCALSVLPCDLLVVVALTTFASQYDMQPSAIHAFESTAMPSIVSPALATTAQSSFKAK